MSRELDVRVARAMGCNVDWATVDGRRVPFCYCERQWGMAPHADSRTLELEYYSTDIAAARQMEDWIEEHGFTLRYARAMLGRVFILERDPAPDCDEQLWWMLLHATPEQRCRAFLAAVEEQCMPS